MKGSSTSFLSSGLILSIVLAYFEYGTIEGALAIGLLYLIISTVNLLSYIPLFGWIASTFINWCFVIPMIISFTGIEMTWLIYLIFIYQCLGGFILTMIILIAFITAIWNS